MKHNNVIANLKDNTLKCQIFYDKNDFNEWMQNHPCLIHDIGYVQRDLRACTIVIIYEEMLIKD